MTYLKERKGFRFRNFKLFAARGSILINVSVQNSEHVIKTMNRMKPWPINYNYLLHYKYDPDRYSSLSFATLTVNTRFEPRSATVSR